MGGSFFAIKRYQKTCGILFIYNGLRCGKALILHNRFKTVSQCSKVLKRFSEGKFHVLRGFWIIVKQDDASGLAMLFYFFKTLCRTYLLVIVTDNIPHHHGISLLQQGSVLCGFHFTIGWAEEGGIHQLAAFICFVQVVRHRALESFAMVHGMISCTVSFRSYSFKYLWVLLNIGPYTKKGGLGPVPFQFVEHPFCELRNGSIIEGKVQHLLVALIIPYSLRVYFFKQRPGLYEQEIFQAIKTNPLNHLQRV